MARYRRVLVTGGAGFVGSSLAIALKHQSLATDVVAFDNLRRRGSETALTRLRERGVAFHHGDVRHPEDLADAGEFELVIDCSAEPSVHAGYNANPNYVINTNLTGTINCLNCVRRWQADMIFLSTSRVYPIGALRGLPLEQRGDRFVVAENTCGSGWSARGIAEDFPLVGGRSMYGATKLASELIAIEYGEMYGLRIIINRCGVVTGPWQMGKVDQGFFALWVARHLYGGELAYMGYGGRGLQVRDILHVADLHQLLTVQLAAIDKCMGRVFNVGGGHDTSVSLAELTRACQKRTGRALQITATQETRAADIPYYVSDNRAVSAATGWEPEYSLEEILDDVVRWLTNHRAALEPIFT